MSNARGPPVGVVQTKRRTWDEDEYRKRAEERAQREAGTVKPSDEFLPASERSALTERDAFYDFQSRVGKVTAVNDKDRSSGGFYCELCDVLLRDSLSFTNHLNGRKHLRKQGVSEYTKRSTLEEVLSVLEFGRRKRFPERYVTERLLSSTSNSNKAQRKERKESNGVVNMDVDVDDKSNSKEKNMASPTSSKDGSLPQNDDNPTDMDPEDAEMQAVLGFTGFGSSGKGKKK